MCRITTWLITQTIIFPYQTFCCFPERFTTLFGHILKRNLVTNNYYVNKIAVSHKLFINKSIFKLSFKLCFYMFTSGKCIYHFVEILSNIRFVERNDFCFNNSLQFLVMHSNAFTRYLLSSRYKIKININLHLRDEAYKTNIFIHCN